MGTAGQKTFFSEVDQKYLTILFESSGQCILVLDNQFQITYANQSAVNLFGYSTSELVGKSLFEFTLNKQLIEEIKGRQLHDQADPPSIEVDFTGRDLRSIRCTMTVLPLENTQNLQTCSILVIHEKLKTGKAETKFPYGQENTVLAAKNEGFGIWEWDVTNDRLIWDDHMFELYDVSPKNFDLVYAGWLKLLAPEDVERNDQAIKHTLATGDPYNTEFRIMQSDHSIRYIKAYGSVFFDSAGHPIRVSGVNLDVTEQKWVAKANRLMIEAQWKIVHTYDQNKIYQIVGQKIQEIIEGGYVAVTAVNEMAGTIHIQWVYGVSETYQNLIDKFKIDPTKIEFLIKEIDPDTLRRYRSGKFEKYPDGLYQLAQKKVPQTICRVVEKAMGIDEIYVMGFVWGERHYGGVIISPSKDLSPVVSCIESIVNLATQAIKKLRAENALRDSEERFRDFFENAPISLWEEDFSLVKQQLDVLKLQGVSDFAEYFSKHPAIVKEFAKQIKILNVNKASLDMFHAKDKNDLIENFNKIVGGKGNNFPSELTNIAEGKIDFEWEGINHTLDGKPRMLNLRWSAAPEDRETFAKVFVSITDVTDRRNTENLLREKERQISTLMSNLSGMVYRCLNDKDWTMEFVSQGVFALTEYSPEEFLNKKVNFGDLILDEDQLKVWNDTQLAYKKNLPFQLTYRIRTKTGQIKWVWEQGRKVSTENNGTVLEGFITDITKPKLAEEAFEYERYLMQALLDNIPDSVYFKDLSSRFIRINQGMARKFGFQSVEEALGKTDADFFLEDIARDGLHEEQKIIQTGEPIIGAESLENWIDQRPPTWASSTKMPLRDKSGKITGTFGISRDITDRKSKEEEIKRLYSDLEKKVQARTKELSLRNQELEAFAYSISHDLKAPLRGINGYSQLLLQEHSNQLDEEGKLFLDKLILSSDQLTKLIDDLFSYTRLERRPINHIDFPVAEMIDAVIAERKSEIHKRGILLHQNVEDRIINSSPELFTQILRNCLDNAIKYTEKVEKPEIWVDFKNQANSSLLTIRDNGIGFDMKYAEKLFDVFYRLHRIDEYPGTGIGLALVKKAAELLGFRIWAEGAEGNGATFYLEIN